MWPVGGRVLQDLPLVADPARVLAPTRREDVLSGLVCAGGECKAKWTMPFFVLGRIHGRLHALAFAPRQDNVHVFSDQRCNALLAPCGRPKSDITQVRVGIGLLAEVIAHFKASGDGWQTRIDAALRQFIDKHPTAS